ncbi:MAG: nucleoside/nucleotide kinase family protein [Pseudomonadota bacterium]
MSAGLAADLAALVPAAGPRFLLGLAGAPASGKSTLAAELAGAIPRAQAMSMDGFHLDDGILEARGHRARKGAPHTFDVAGFCALLRRLRVEDQLYAPAFDRDLEVSRAGAVEIAADTRLVIVEGNYLLHDTGGWEAVRGLLDLCWFLDVPEADLIARLEARWAHHGKSVQAARHWIESNDLPNIRTVAGAGARADRVLSLTERVDRSVR